MPSINENSQLWNFDYNWQGKGDEWSFLWGSPEMQWYGTILPRIHQFLPTGTILEIGCGFGRWTQFLKDNCENLILIDISQKCIEACQNRFANFDHISYFVNDGKCLDMIADGSLDFAYSFESLVHAEADVIEAYINQLARKLKPSGVGFIHHSNIGEYTEHFARPEVTDNAHWRAFTMTASKFKYFLEQAGLHCNSQEVIKWGRPNNLIDCISLFTPPDSQWVRSYKLLRNQAFMEEANYLSGLSDLYAANPSSQKLPLPPKPTKVPVVFFGRLEKRKGLLTFVESLKRLSPQIKEQIQVIFVGKVQALASSSDQPLNSKQYIERELEDSLSYQIISNLYSEQAIRYVSNLENPIVCLTSPQENFPNSALEMGQLPVKLVVSDNGGFRETLALLERTTGIYWFTPEDANSLARQLSQGISEAELIPDIPDPASLQGINHKLLSQKLEYIERAFAEVRQPEKPEVRVTLAVVCNNPDSRLIECLSSLESQTYDNLEVFIVDAGSTKPTSQEVIRQAQSLFPNCQWLQLESGQGLGAAYNYLADLSTGDYFLPLQPDIVLFPFAVAKLVETACQTRPVAVTCARINAGGGVVNFSAANLPSLLVADARGCDCTLLSRTFLKVFKFRESQDDASPVAAVIAAAVVTGEKLAYYPYPLYEGRAEAELTAIRRLDVREQYSLRQYLMQIPPAQWSPRQIYLLLAAAQQLPDFYGKMTQLPDFSQEVAQLQAQLQQQSEQLTKAQKWRSDLVLLKRELAQAKARIRSMETSKFWQLREGWFRLKRLLGLPGD